MKSPRNIAESYTLNFTNLFFPLPLQFLGSLSGWIGRERSKLIPSLVCLLTADFLNHLLRKSCDFAGPTDLELFLKDKADGQRL